MIAGIGIDLTTVSRIRTVHDRFTDRFARRFLHENEIDSYQANRQKERFLAKRFAAKEAAVKALGTGERNGILLKDFYVGHDSLGKPLLYASGQAKVRCDALGITHLWLTLTDEGDTVAAFVVLESN